MAHHYNPTGHNMGHVDQTMIPPHGGYIPAGHQGYVVPDVHQVGYGAHVPVIDSHGGHQDVHGGHGGHHDVHGGHGGHHDAHGGHLGGHGGHHGGHGGHH